MEAFDWWGGCAQESYLCVGYNQVITWHWISHFFTSRSWLNPCPSGKGFVSTGELFHPGYPPFIICPRNFYLDFYFLQLGLAQTHTNVSCCTIFFIFKGSAELTHPLWQGTPVLSYIGEVCCPTWLGSGGNRPCVEGGTERMLLWSDPCSNKTLTAVQNTLWSTAQHTNGL